jgi:hypothetical protein
MLPNGRCSPNEMAIALHFVRLCPTRTEGQRQPSGSLGISGPAAATDTSAPLDQQRNSCPYRLASRGSHVRGVLWQVRLNRFHKDRFRCGGTRARAPASARGTERCCVVLPKGSRSLDPIRSGSLLTPLHANAPLPPAGPAGRFSPGGVWDPKGVLGQVGRIGCSGARSARLGGSHDYAIMRTQGRIACVPTCAGDAPFEQYGSSIYFHEFQLH